MPHIVNALPGVTGTPVTAPLPAAGSAAGALLIAIAVDDVAVVHLRVSVPYKWVITTTTALAATAFAGTGHFKRGSGDGAIPVLGQDDDAELYLEADTAGSITADGVSYVTEAYP